MSIRISDQDHDDIHVGVLGLSQLPQVLGMMVRSQYDNDPLHGSSDPISIDLLHIVLFNQVHLVDGLRQSCQSLLLHLPVLQLSILSIESIEFLVMCLKLVSKVI